MKKVLAVMAVTAALAIALGGTLVVSAQGRGSWGGGGMMGRGGWTEGVAPGGGVLGGALDAYLAPELGLTVEQFQAMRAEGLTLYQIAVEQGFEAADLPALMQQARDAALTDAVEAGTITQEQAEWMSQRGAGMFGGQDFAGRGGRGGRGGGMFGGNGGTCPYGYENGSQGRWNGAATS